MIAPPGSRIRPSMRPTAGRSAPKWGEGLLFMSTPLPVGTLPASLRHLGTFRCTTFARATPLFPPSLWP